MTSGDLFTERPRVSVAALSRRRVPSPVQSTFRPAFKPSETRIAHHDLALVDIALTKKSRPVEVWRRCAGLYGLLRSRAITEGQVSAAQFWATDYEIGVLGGTDPEMEHGAKRGDIHDAMIGRMGSAARRDYIRQRIGARGEQLLVLLMIEGLSLNDIASHLHQDKRNTSGALCFLLEQLTEHYDGMPGPLWKG
ncbi:hypothetical protein CFR77_15340 [Komagataeibacter sucrofermentans]|uniref:Uncharacterized protein n=1 Tax=Komagataeibacter sucrofermentans TaxID=1053551 RepID=A0A318QCU4_9PROT|nr:hypothetical protein CFR77_15340 [Komagataeibacter sucrofermentans]GBQ51597.1 hypothetical protein AA15973_2445 [Komagataeibacter sucrofermentans DSM 15973]